MSPAVAGRYLSTVPPGESFILFVICVSLMTNEVEHLFMFLFAVLQSPLARCLFKFFVHLLIGFFFLFLVFENSFYILRISPLLDI